MICTPDEVKSTNPIKVLLSTVKWFLDAKTLPPYAVPLIKNKTKGIASCTLILQRFNKVVFVSEIVVNTVLLAPIITFSVNVV